eukprot:531708_1
MGGMSVFIILVIEFVYLSVICFGLGTVDIMGNIIYLVAANSNKKSEEWAVNMTRIFWAYRVISAWALLTVITVFAMTEFDALKIPDYATRNEQTIQSPTGLMLFIFCWISTPIWQWVGAVIIFDYKNLASVARDVAQLAHDQKWTDVLELISFGARFEAEQTLINILNESDVDNTMESISKICVKEINKEENGIKNMFFRACNDNQLKTITYLLDTTNLNVSGLDDNGRTALFYAACNNHLAIVKLLVKDKNAALHYTFEHMVTSAIEKNLDIIKCLVEEGESDVNSINKNGYSIYDTAKNAKHDKSVLNYLEENGARPNSKTEVEKTETKQEDENKTNVSDKNETENKNNMSWQEDKDANTIPILSVGIYAIAAFGILACTFGLIYLLNMINYPVIPVIALICLLPYIILGMIILCNDFVIPAMTVAMKSLNLSTSDIPNATFVSFGLFAPQIFISCIGTVIFKSDIGLGVVVGSGMFNMLFVFGCFVIFAPSARTVFLLWYPFTRDVIYGIISLCILAICFNKQRIFWWETVLLFWLYLFYLILISNNTKMYNWISKNIVNVSERDRMRDVTEQLRPAILAQQNLPSIFEAITVDQHLSHVAGLHAVDVEKSTVQDALRMVDTNDIGVIDKEQLRELLQTLHVVCNDKKLNEIFERFAGEEVMEYEGFARWFSQSELRHDFVLNNIFETCDPDENGFVDVDHLEYLITASIAAIKQRALLQYPDNWEQIHDIVVPVTDEDLQNARKILDKNNDGKISSEEFVIF